MLRCDELLGYQCLRHLNCKVYGYCGTELFSLIFSQVKTVKISNISLSASQRDIQEFFCFSGDIDYVEMQRSFFYPLFVPHVYVYLGIRK